MWWCRLGSGRPSTCANYSESRQVAARRASSPTGWTRPHPHESSSCCAGVVVPLLRSSAELLFERILARRPRGAPIDTAVRDRRGLPCRRPVRCAPGESSLPVLMADLRDAGLGDVEVLVEHRLPLSSKRTDVILCGHHPQTGEPVLSGRRTQAVVACRRPTPRTSSWSTSTRTVVDRYCIPGRQVAELRRLHASTSCGHSRTTRTRLQGAAYLHNASESRLWRRCDGGRRRRPAGCSPG